MNIALNITECCICGCCRKVIQKTYNIYNLSDSITLANGYTLSVLSYNTFSASILIQNENSMYIRTLFTAYPFEIRLNVPSSCCCYILSIQTVINS